MKRLRDTYQLKVLTLILWVLFTSTMVIWWGIYGLSENTGDTDSLMKNRMLIWEGVTFLCAIFAAGFYLWRFIKQDKLQHNQLRIFFSNFSHDIKTSITRLRLQSEVLQDEENYSRDPKLKQLIQDISRLDLQLENSLYLAQEDTPQVFPEKVRLSELIQSIRSDFPEIELYLEKDVLLEADKRLFLCVLRNLISNSVLHGQATQIKIKVTLATDTAELLISDDGRGTAREMKGTPELLLRGEDSKGHGIGLYLCHQLLEKMQGHFRIVSSQPHFSVAVQIKGRAL